MEREKDKEKEKEKRDPIRFWGGVLGASALGLAVVAAVVVQVQTPKPKMAAKTQAPARTAAAVRTQAAVKTPAAVKPQAAVKTPAAVKSQAAVKTPATVTPISDAERKLSEELWVEQKKLDAHSARVTATTPEGRRRVAATIAKQFNVPEKLVGDLRSRKIGYGEITVALALSQQLMKRDKVTRQKALDNVLGLRKSGQGWAALARSLGLKLGDALGHVKKADKQLARFDTGTSKVSKS